MSDKISISAAQSRAARALLDWSRAELAEKSGVSAATLADFEAGKRKPYDRTLDDVRAALETAGVIFVEENGEGPGVRLRKTQMSNAPIYVDPARSAVLKDGAHSTNCPTLGEAKIAYDKLPPERKERAVIVYLGRAYSSDEIKRFHYGPKPAA